MVKYHLMSLYFLMYESTYRRQFIAHLKYFSFLSVIVPNECWSKKQFFKDFPIQFLNIMVITVFIEMKKLLIFSTIISEEK